MPTKTKITKSLLVGSLIFGVGRGLAGYCPGPAIVSLGSFQTQALTFVLGVIGGMSVFKILDKQIKFNR